MSLNIDDDISEDSTIDIDGNYNEECHRYKTLPPKRLTLKFRKSASSSDLPTASFENSGFHNITSFENSTAKDNIQRESTSSTLSFTSSSPSSNEKSFDTFMKDGFRKIDFILVYKKVQKSEYETKRRRFFERHLKHNGLQLEFEEFTDVSEEIVFVKIHAPWQTLCTVAEDLKLKMPLWLDERPVLKKHSATHTFFQKLCKCNFFAQPRGLTREQVAKSIVTWPFSDQNKDRYAIKDRRSFFSSAQRIEIVWRILQKTRNHVEDPRKRGVEELLERKIYVCGYPLHEGSTYSPVDAGGPLKNSPRMQLLSGWASWSQILVPQPLRKIQKYFGHKIGFYFAFMDFYLKMLIFPAVAGVIVILYGLITFTDNHPEIRDICDRDSAPGNYVMCPICRPPNCDMWFMADEGCYRYKMEFRLDNEATVVMSCFTLLWGIIFVKLWRRQEAKCATDWDTIDYKVREETVRPMYETTAPSVRKNSVTFQWEPYWPVLYRAVRIAISVLVTCIILALAELTLFSIVISRIHLYGALKGSSSVILSDYNIFTSRFLTNKFVFVSILIFEYIYGKLAFVLTKFESPRTNHNFTNSLLVKLFVFQLLNNFIPICYSAWMKGKIAKSPLKLNYFTELCDGGCVGEIVELVATLLIARLIIQNVFEIVLPIAKNLFKRYKYRDLKDHHLLPRWIKDYHLIPVELDGIYEDYMEMMIQFAFLIFCVSVFPAIPLICFVNNIFEIRIDAMKLIKSHRRPVPERVRGIHTWKYFLDAIIKIGIVFNAALIAFNSNSLPRLFYIYEYSNSTEIYGYTEYSLSNITLKKYNKAYGNESYQFILQSMAKLGRNDTVCWYTGFKYRKKPCNQRCEYWRVLAIRLSAFGFYTTVFYAIMWLINTLIDDVPSDVRSRMKRRKHIVMKSLEAEGALKKRNVKRLYESDSPKLSPVLNLARRK